MRLLLDEHFSGKITAQLRAKGHDALGVCEHPGLGRLTDDELLAWAASEARVVVTENARHFVPLSARWLREGRSHHGIVCTSPRRFPRHRHGPLVRALDALMATTRADNALKDSVRWLAPS